MTTQIIISPKLAWGLTIFAAGLVVLGGLVIAALVLATRRQHVRGDDQVVRLLRNSAVPFALQLLIKAIDFAFAMALFRLLLVQEIVNYDFAALIATLVLGTVAEWGLNIYLTREVARDPAAIERTFGTALFVRFLLAALVIPASLLVVWTYNALQAAGLSANGFDRQGLWVMLLLAATVLPGALSAAVTALFLATERPIVPAVVGLLTNIVSALLKTGALVLGLGPIGVAWAVLLATCASSVVFAVLLRRFWGWPHFHFDRGLALHMLRVSFPLMLNALLLAVFFRFDATIIRAARSYVEYSSYMAAYKYVALTQILPPIVINAVFPLFARQAVNDRGALRRAYEYLVRMLVLLALPIATVITVLAPLCLALVGGATFVQLGAPALALLIWYLPLSYVNGVTQYVLIALERPRTITLSFALAAVFNFAFNLLFVPRFGINAAAVATVLSEIVLFFPLWRVLRTELEPQPLWRVLWRPALAALGMALAMLALAQVHVLISALAGPLVFGGLLLAVGAVEDEDRRLARRVLRRV